MKKQIMVFGLFLLLLLAGCAGKGEGVSGSVLFKRLDEVDEFLLNEGDAGDGRDIIITDPEEKSRLVRMLSDHRYTKGERFEYDRVGCGMSISWRQPEDGLLVRVELSGRTILYQDWFYSVSDGELDMSCIYQLIYRDATFCQGEELFDLSAASRVSAYDAWENRTFEIEAGEDVEKIKDLFSAPTYMGRGLKDDGYSEYFLEWYDEAGNLLSRTAVHGNYGMVYDGTIYLIVSADGIDTQYLYNLEKEILHLPDPTPLPTLLPEPSASAPPAPTDPRKKAL